MDVGTALVAHPQAAVLVQPGDQALDHPALLAQTGAMRALRGRDLGLDSASPQLTVVALGPVGAIGQQPIRALPRPAPPAADRGNRIDEGDQLGDVVAVGGG